MVKLKEHYITRKIGLEKKLNQLERELGSKSISLIERHYLERRYDNLLNQYETMLLGAKQDERCYRGK